MLRNIRFMYFLLFALIGSIRLSATSALPRSGWIQRANEMSLLFAKTDTPLSPDEITTVIESICEVGLEATNHNSIPPETLRTVEFDVYTDSIYTISPLIIKVLRNDYRNILYSNHLMAHAAKVGDVCAMTILFRNEVGVTSEDVAGNTPLHYAAIFNSPESANWLLARGANIDAPNKAGQTPLYLACNASRSGYLRRIQAARIDFRLLSDDALNKLAATAIALLDAGANPNLVPQALIVSNTRFFYHPHTQATLAPIRAPKEGSLAYPYDWINPLYASTGADVGDSE